MAAKGSDQTKAHEGPVTAAEIGERLGLSKNAVYEALARGDIPSIRIGRRIVVPRPAWDRWLIEAPLKRA